VINALTGCLTLVFDWLLKPFGALTPAVGLYAVSFVTGILFLKLFGLFSNQAKIKAAKSKIQAHILEIVLFRNHLGLSLKAAMKALGTNLLYLRYALVPFLVLMVPAILILAQLYLRYEHRPLKVGDETWVTVKVAERQGIERLKLSASGGLEVILPPLMLKAKHEASWRVKALEPGKKQVTVQGENQTYSMDVYVGDSAPLLSSGRFKNWFKSLLYSADPNLGKESNLEEIFVKYPKVNYALLGFQVHWMLIFLGVSLAAGFLFKGVLKVEI